MKKFSHIFLLILTGDIILLAIGLINISYIAEKADFPEFSGPFNQNCIDCIYESDKIIKIAGYEVKNNSIYETILDFHKAGEQIDLVVLRENESVDIQITLVNYYNFSFLLITIIVSLFFLIPAIFIFYKLTDRLLANVFHWMMISVVIMLFFTFGTIPDDRKYFIILTRTIDLISYLLLSITFLHFSLLYPFRKFINTITRFKYFYFLIIPLFIGILILNYFYIIHPGEVIFRLYNQILIYFIKPFFIPFYLFVVINTLHSYIKSSKQIERDKLLWIFISVLWGPSIFIILYLLPGITLKSPAISEATMQILIIISPITLFIAIYKYSLFDIKLFLRRSAVYGFFFTILLIFYLSLIYFFGAFYLSETNQIRLAGLVTILLTVLLYKPVKGRLQKFVDTNFFKIDLNLSTSEKIIKSRIWNSVTTGQLLEVLDDFFSKFVKVESYNYLHIYDSNDLQLIKTKNSELNSHQIYNINEFAIIHKGIKVIAYPSVFSDNIQHYVDRELLKLINAELVIYFYSESGFLNSAVVLGMKSNGIAYTIEDYDIITSIINEIAIKYDFIEIQKELLFKSEEIKKLEEINTVKNYFVSNVSHEFKTPLTAISLFSEFILNNTALSEEKRKEYLTIIIGECQRLTRLINNVLDFSKIERGAKDYNFEVIDLNIIVENVVSSISYLLIKGNFLVNYEKNGNEYMIYGESDSLNEVFYNLIDNAMKYSGSRKEISISTYEKNNKYIFEIEDKGIGIKKEHQQVIFDAYYRVVSEDTKSISGTGLGMSIVNNIIRAHKSSISLESEYGKGTKIIIEFPGV
ncbi:MAG: hypothetical protein KIT33_02320 [Candidatus Kapabacteria bacterium]|nr:hypothetical protein [Ignavibacteriota bacterium]MCW5883785.1 hypothetical protein [Candidatus Kapabacteria bacterium]